MGYAADVPTRIFFANAQSSDWAHVNVQEEPETVQDAWHGAQGLPFRLTLTGSKEQEVWVNPSQVTYFTKLDADEARAV